MIRFNLKVSRIILIRVGFLLSISASILRYAKFAYLDILPNCLLQHLKELRNRILRTTLVWKLLCLIRLYVGLHFSTSSCRKIDFCLSVVSLNQDIKICIIMLCNFDMYFCSHLI